MYRTAGKKVLALPDSKRHQRDSDAMDIGACGFEDEPDGPDEPDVATVVFQVLRAWPGHRSADYATPPPLEGKGKERKARAREITLLKRARARAQAGGEHARGKVSHGASNCWSVHPEHMPWKRAACLDCEQDPMARDIGHVPGPPSSTS